MSNSQSKSGGVGFTGLLAILFIGLKLGGVINWPWIWVLSPIWIPLAIVLVVAVIVLIGVAFVNTRAERKAKAYRARRII